MRFQMLLVARMLPAAGLSFAMLAYSLRQSMFFWLSSTLLLWLKELGFTPSDPALLSNLCMFESGYAG